MIRIPFFLVAAVVCSGGLAIAQGPAAFPLTRITGIVGIGPSQTARLNVLNPGIGAPFLGVRCTGTLTFLDDQGQALKTDTMTIDPGKSASIELRTEAFNGRVELYALISTPPIGQAPNVGYCTLVPTIEVIDNATGNTVAMLTESRIRPPVPSPAAADAKQSPASQ